MSVSFKHLEQFYEESGRFDDGRVEYYVKDGYEVVCNGNHNVSVINVKDDTVVEIFDEDCTYGGSTPENATFTVYKLERKVEAVI